SPPPWAESRAPAILARYSSALSFCSDMRRSLSLLLGAFDAFGILCAEQPWWEREPLRIIDFPTSMSRIDYRDPAQLAQQQALLGFNTEHFEVMGMTGGLDDRQFFFKSKLAAAPHPDYLGRYLTQAKKRGSRAFIYFDVNYYWMRFA